MTGNTLPGLTSLVSNCIGQMHVYEYGDNINNPYWIIHPVCQQGTVQFGGASVIVWDVCSWRDMGPLIRLETTLTGDMYLSILYDHLILIHVHCAFQWIGTIPAGRCDTPRVESCYQVAPRTLF
ncbi:hypothetical protein AVEN_253909-1 [Araneus ventricosus]|uniref:Uncharacterized protein n=1 Tax=Araneus ventricosus TaxID=182803 RepID=A0A4Y2ELG5_ARAVE|nr:hypothetical protein AVEN_253909-1 [Araneus ventricosus]